LRKWSYLARNGKSSRIAFGVPTFVCRLHRVFLFRAYRLYGRDGRPILDVMLGHDEDAPVAGERILCRHPFHAHKRAAVTPAMVEKLHVLVFDQGQVTAGSMRTLKEAQAAVHKQLHTFRGDILRNNNPTPYKVSVSDAVFEFLHKLWQSETPVAEIY
jgi:nicotinate phosphoribosyltransferase